MKILITVDSYYPDKNGVQYVTQYQAEGLASLGHEVTVIASNNQNSCQNEDEHNGVKIIRIDAYNKNMFHYGDQKCYQMCVIEQSNKSDVMMNVCLQSFAADWILPVLDKIKCKKILMMHSMHDFSWHKKDLESKNEFIKKILRDIRWRQFYQANWKFIKKYDNVIHLHEKDVSYQYFQKKGYKNNAVIYNAVEDEFFKNHKKENLIISVASYNSRKNQMLALQSFYKANTGSYKLVLIGLPENVYYRSLLTEKEKLEKQYGFKNVEILVNLDRESTKRYIFASKIYLMTSTWEGFPISIIEAMASGATFISTDVGIVKYLKGGAVVMSKKEIIERLEEMTSGAWYKQAQIAKKYTSDNMNREIQVLKLEGLMKKE